LKIGLFELRVKSKEGITRFFYCTKMGTKAPAVTRLESSLTSGNHSPSLATIKKYAEAVNCRVEIKLVHN
jgi:transcriptional regulator with XRE-family HTH domain